MAVHDHCSEQAASCSQRWHCHTVAACGPINLAYQLARRCLTRGTVHTTVTSQLLALPCDVHAHEQTGRTPANGTWPQCSQGRICSPCSVCVKMFPRLELVHRRAEREHNILADWASGYYCYYHLIRLHLTTHSLPCIHLPWRLHALVCSLCPADHTATDLPFGSSQRSCASPDSRSNKDRQCSVAAWQLLCRSLIINRFSRFDHRIRQ